MHRPPSRSRALLVGALALSCACVIACKKSASHDDPTTYVVRHDGGETRVTMGPGAVPPEFPPTLRLYPGAVVSSTARTAKSVVLALSTTDACDAVVAFHRAQDGYEEIGDVEVNGMRVVRFRETASRKEVQVLVKSAGARCEISLVAPLS